MKCVAFIILFSALGAIAQTNQTAAAAAATRPMTLQNCLRLALSQNFDVQVQRINPQIALFALETAYAGWEPAFNISGQHNNTVSPASLTANEIQIPSSTSDENQFSSGIKGVLPWGLQYDFSGNVSDTYGTKYSTDTNGFITGSPFRNSAGSISVTMTQPILKNFWIDGTRLAIRVAGNRLKYSKQGLRLQLITTVTAVANAYYELIYAQGNLEVQQQALQLAQTQLSQDRQRAQIGTLPPLNLRQDESQVAQSQANLIAAQDTLLLDQNTLKNLITDNYTKWHDVDIQPSEPLAAPLVSFNLQNSWAAGMDERPDLIQARLNLQEQGI
ncbi:MAG: TolC family protein, partial [Verrucomicrobia bacterium]|nr:TolC family protein [Verrucomicrobiota bacterium]